MLLLLLLLLLCASTAELAVLKGSGIHDFAKSCDICYEQPSRSQLHQMIKLQTSSARLFAAHSPLRTWVANTLIH